MTPLVGEFLCIYQGQEYQGSIDVINNLDSYIQLNKSGYCWIYNSSSAVEWLVNIFVKILLVPDNYGLKIDDEIITYTGIGTTLLRGVLVVLLVITKTSNTDAPGILYFRHHKAFTVGVGTSGGTSQ